VPTGAPVASFSLAVDRPFKDQSGNRATDFIDIVTWRKLAEQVSQYATKGRLVAVEGQLQIRSYEAKDGGGKRKVAEVVADAVRFLDSKRAQNGAADGQPEAHGDGASDDSEQHGAEPVGAGAAGDEDVPF